MLLILIPLIPFVCSVFLLSTESEHALRLHHRLLVTGCALTSFFLTGWITIQSRGTHAIEYLFSQLFKLPGTTESLSFSLYLDSLSAMWLLLLTGFCFILTLLGILTAATPSAKPCTLSAIQLTQAGMATLCLSGSLVTILIGWGILIAAVFLASIRNQRANGKNHGLGFMILMISVFFLLSSIYFLYGTMGKLSFTHDPVHLQATITALINTQNQGIINSVINMTGFCLLLGVLPLMGLIPFTPWLEDLRSAHPLNRITVLMVILPVGTLVLQRYSWFLSLTPILRFSLITISIVSLIAAIIACISQKGGKLTLPWLAVAGTAMLAISVAGSPIMNTKYLLLTTYPGIFVFCIGRTLTLTFKRSFGRIAQVIGLITIPVCVLSVPIFFNDLIAANQMMHVLFNLIILVPAISVYRHSASSEDDVISFTSTLGWAAFQFYGMATFLKQVIAMPIQQLSDGFWTLETYHNQFWQHGLGKGIKNSSRLLLLFDRWFIEGATRWMKRSKQHRTERIDSP